MQENLFDVGAVDHCIQFTLAADSLLVCRVQNAQEKTTPCFTLERVPLVIQAFAGLHLRIYLGISILGCVKQ